MPICLHIVYGCFRSRMSDFTSFDRPYTLQSWKYSLSGPSQKLIYPCQRAECRRTTSMLKFFVSIKNEKVHSTQAGQNYFQNNMKKLFIFFIWFSPSTQWSFPEATWCVMSQQTTCRSRHEIQLFSLKWDIKEIRKNCYSSD